MGENSLELDSTYAGTPKISAWELKKILKDIEDAYKSGQNDSKTWDKLFENTVDYNREMAGSNAISATVEKQVIESAFAHPSWGCNRISSYLRLNGTFVSAPTVQKIYIRNGLACMKDRCDKLEKKLFSEEMDLTEEQIGQIEKNNPCFRERHMEPNRPGEILHQETFHIGFYKDIGKVYLHAVVDAFGVYAFGYLNNHKKAEHAAVLLFNEVLPFYHMRNLKIGAVYTDKGAEFHGSSYHPYELYLALNRIEHRMCQDAAQVNGYLKRFYQTALEEFFRTAQGNEYNTLESLQSDFDDWLTYYNIERPNKGYPNWGKKPINIVENYKYTAGSE